MTNTAKELATVLNENQKPLLTNLNHKFMIKSEDGEMVECVQAALIPHGMELTGIKGLLDEYAEKPDRRTDSASFDRVPSLIEYINRFKSKNSAVFARGKISGHSVDATMKAVLDYHPEGSDKTDADFCDHTALYRFPISKEFQKWISMNGEAMSQADFAHFIEDRLHDMTIPEDGDSEMVHGLDFRFADPIQMLELARGLDVRNNESVKQKYATSSGETEIQYTAEHADAEGQPLRVPNFFILNIPVFEMGEDYRIAVRLRYRVNSGSVKFWFDLYRVEQVFDAAFDLVCEQVKDGTKLPVFIGSNDGRF